MEEKIINIEDVQIKELEELKEKYLEVEMPKEQVEKLKLAIEKGKREHRKEQRKTTWTRLTISAAAVMAAIIILPNTSSGIAYAMERIPFLGSFVKLVTWREYQYEDERHQADIEVAKLEIGSGMSATNVEGLPVEESFDCLEETEESVDDVERTEGCADDVERTEGYADDAEETEETVNYTVEIETLKNSAEEINSEIEKITNRLIEEFETHIQEEMGYRDLVVKSQVIAQNENYFTLNLSCFEAAASGYEWNYFYTIDLNTGKRLQLKDLFKDGADYITVISDNIKKQMKEQMEADENIYYWLEDEIEEWNFKTITEDTLFYLNEEGKVIISFNEGDVAPMYMGVVEFVIEKEVLRDIWR